MKDVNIHEPIEARHDGLSILPRRGVRRLDSFLVKVGPVHTAFENSQPERVCQIVRYKHLERNNG